MKENVQKSPEICQMYFATVAERWDTSLMIAQAERDVVLMLCSIKFCFENLDVKVVEC